MAATLALNRRAGIAVAATGGIGGVHPGGGDVSADLVELGRTPGVLVCSGAKAIVDMAATLERLETLGVTVAGWRTAELPAFWTAGSGLPLDLVLEGADEAADVWREARALDLPGALLVCAPPPAASALVPEKSAAAVERAAAEAAEAGIAGGDATTWLLARIAELTDGRSLRANLDLLESNVGIAATIATAVAVSESSGRVPHATSRSGSAE